MFKRNVRTGLVTMGRGNGKSALAACLAIWSLFSEEGAQVLLVASSERQARIVFGMVRRIIELDENLSAHCQIHHDRILYPARDGSLFTLPATEASLQGYDPSVAIVDELHVASADVWESMTTAAGKRERSLVLGITTAGGDKDGILWKLTEHGRLNEDPSFAFVEFSAPDECEIDDPKAWKAANPALGDFLYADSLKSNLKQTRPEVFRRLRLNQWVAESGAWLPWGSWDELEKPSRIIDPFEPIVLAFDGSISDDSTAIVGCTVSTPHHVFAVKLWEKEEPNWRVPRSEVTQAVADAFNTYNVVELSCDPWHWQSEIELWSTLHRNVVEFPTNALNRMAPATDLLRTAVIEQSVSHDGNEDLARHVRNATVKETALGDVIVKDRRGSPRKIDGAVTAIVSHARAAWHASQPTKRRRVVVR